MMSATTKRALRSNSKVRLIGFVSKRIAGARLPSAWDVMRHFMFHLHTQKLSVRQSATNAYKQLLPFRLKAKLPVREYRSISFN